MQNWYCFLILLIWIISKPNAIEVDIDSCSNEFLMQQANEHGVSCDYLNSMIPDMFDRN